MVGVPVVPDGDRVLIKAEPYESKTEHGILLTSGTKNSSWLKAEVIQIGQGVRSPTFAIGDFVGVRTYTGTPVQIDGEEYQIVDSKEVFFVFERE
jgi:co-chaperonin GroES (HSP10)